MPARPAPRRGRHAAPRHAAPRRLLRARVLLPGAALVTLGGGSLALLGPASAVPAGPSTGRPVAAAAVAPLALEPAAASVVPPPVDYPDEAERASRSRRLEPVAPPAPPPAPAYVRPVDGPETSPFGMRWGRLHAGIDFGVPVGTPVRAVADGVVTAMPYDAGGYGNHLQLLLADGTVVVLGHLSEELVTAGPVTAGQVIALSGNTGHSTGPHLHVELRGPAGPFDPRPWLEARGVVV